MGTLVAYRWVIRGRFLYDNVVSHFRQRRIPLMSRIDLVSKNLLATCFRNFSKKRFKENCYQKSIEEIVNFEKIAKVTRIFLAMWKDWAKKYGKNSKNNKFKILHLEREKVKNGFVKSANFAKIAKVTRLFLAIWKDWVLNMAKIARIANFTKFYPYKEKRLRRASWSPQHYICYFCDFCDICHGCF